jgi:hypothetical protein
MDSRVLEHLDTKSITEWIPSSRRTAILVKWRPFGRLSNRPAKGRIPPNILRSRNPVSLGEVRGMFHASLPLLGEINARSSRRGKEQIRSKMSGEIQTRRSDLRVADIPWNGARGTRSQRGASKCKCTRLWNARIQPPSSTSAAVIIGIPRTVRLRVW